MRSHTVASLKRQIDLMEQECRKRGRNPARVPVKVIRAVKKIEPFPTKRIKVLAVTLETYGRQMTVLLETEP